MITKKDLRKLARKRFRDSSVLLNNRRYQGSVYLEGYVIETLLKYKISKLFNLYKGYPETLEDLDKYKTNFKAGFINAVNVNGIKNYKTHNLAAQDDPQKKK